MNCYKIFEIENGRRAAARGARAHAPTSARLVAAARAALHTLFAIHQSVHAADWARLQVCKHKSHLVFTLYSHMQLYHSMTYIRD